MTAQETAWQAGESAAAVIGPEADMLASLDAAGLGQSTLSVMRAAARIRPRPRQHGCGTAPAWR